MKLIPRNKIKLAQKGNSHNLFEGSITWKEHILQFELNIPDLNYMHFNEQVYSVPQELQPLIIQIVRTYYTQYILQIQGAFIE
jgi:hypothetical protein